MVTVVIGPSRIAGGTPLPPGGLTLDSTKTTVQLTAAGSGMLPVVFGQCFKKGDVPAAVGTDLATGSQFTVMNRWTDGSVKFGIFAGRANFIGAPITVALGPGTMPTSAVLTLADLQATGLIANVVVTNGWGTAALNLASPIEQTISGPEMSEWIFESLFNDGTTFWPDYHVRYYVRLFVGGKIAVMVSLGNGYVNSPNANRALGDATLRIGGVVRWTSPVGFQVYHHQRIVISRQDGVWNGDQWHWVGVDPRVAPKHDTAYLRTTKMMPNYMATSVTSTSLNALSGTHVPQGLGNLPGNGWGGGGEVINDYLGYFPGWDACHIASGGDSRAYWSVLCNALSQGVYSFHDPDPTTKKPLLVGDWPTSGRPARAGGEQYTALPDNNEIDVSHGPPVGYFAYLLTGDRWFLEELQHLIGWGYLAYFRGGGGDGQSRSCDGGQQREVSFHFMRNLMLGIAITPDADPLPGNANIARRNDYLAYYGYNVAYWDNRKTLVPPTQYMTLGWNTSDHVSSTYASTWFNPDPGGGLVQNPFTNNFGAYFMGMAKDLEVNRMLAIGYQANFDAWMTYTLGTSVKWYGDAVSGDWLYRYAGVYYTFISPDGTWPSDGSSFTAGQAFNNMFGQPNAPALMGDGKIMRMGASDPRNLGNWLVANDFSDPNMHYNYFELSMCALAQAVDQGISGASAAWQRISAAPNWATCVATLTAGPKYGIQPRVALTPPPSPGRDVEVRFVWPAFFNSGVASQIDMSRYVPGYVAGTTTLSLVPYPDKGQAMSSPYIPPVEHMPGVTFDGRYLKYDGVTTIRPPTSTGSFTSVCDRGMWKLQAANPTFLSNPFTVTISFEPTWQVADPYNWDLGDSGGTYTTVLGIRNAIASTGGWAQVPGTRLTDLYELDMNEGKNRWRNITYGDASAGTTGATGGYLDTWSGAARLPHDGGFLVGACGGHYTFWGNPMFGVRFTDPPGVVCFHRSFPAGMAMTRGNSGVHPEWGLVTYDITSPGAYELGVSGQAFTQNHEKATPVWGIGGHHQYHSPARIETSPTKKYLYSGVNCWYVYDTNKGVSMAWEFDLSASTPRAGWRPMSLWEALGQSGPIASPSDPTLPTVVGTAFSWSFPNGEVEVAFAMYDPTLREMVTTVRNVLPAGKPIRAGGWVHNNKIYTVGKTAPTTVPNILTNVTDNIDVGVVPSWWADDALDFAGGIVMMTGTDGHVKAVGWNNPPAPPRIGKVFCLDTVTGVVQEFTDTTGAPQADGGSDGTWGRWMALPAAKCFAALSNAWKFAYIFRPPATWNLFT